MVQCRLRQCWCWSTPLSESHHRHLWPLQITITRTESAFLIFFVILGWKILACPGIEFTSSLSGAVYKLIKIDVQSTPLQGSCHRHNHVYGHRRLLLPRLRVPCWFFLQSRVEKLLAWAGIEPTTLDLSFQSGAFDNSATLD